MLFKNHLACIPIIVPSFIVAKDSTPPSPPESFTIVTIFKDSDMFFYTIARTIDFT